MLEPDNRTVRVFVSSTFRDFRVEREILAKRVFPALRQKMRDRGVTLNDIDLRWGITEQQAERGETLPICLSLIDQSRPYFIGLLGERYGWIAPDGTITDDLKARFPVLEGAEGLSVTEIELRHAILSRNSPNPRAYVFLRDRSWLTRLGSDALNDHVAESEHAQQQLTRLKDALTRSGLAHVEGYSSPDEFAKLIAARLLEALEADFPAPESLDWVAEEDRRHGIFRAQYSTAGVGHEAYIARLDHWLDDEAACPVIVTGPSGSGKSTLLASWVSHHRAVCPQDHVFEHYLGATADSGDIRLVLRRLIAVLAGDSANAEEAYLDDEELIAALPNSLARAGANAARDGYRWLIVLDGLENLSTRQDLTWLPTEFPRPVRLLTSASGSAAINSFLHRGWRQLITEPLSRENGRRLIEGSLHTYGKTLTPGQSNRIMSHALAGLPLFLKTLGEELRLFGEYERLDAQLEWYLAARDIPDLFDRLLTRFEKDFGAELTQGALTAIWAGRAGIEQKELLSLLGVSEAIWQPLCHSLAGAVREASGRLVIAHEFFRTTIETRYLKSAQQRDDAHQALARHFSRHEWPSRRAEEWPWQLIQAHDIDALEKLLTDLDQFQMLVSTGHEQMRTYCGIAMQRGRDILAGLEKSWNAYHKDIEDALWAQKTAYFNPKNIILPELLEFVLRSGYPGRFAAEIASQIVDMLRYADKFDTWWRDSLASALLVLRESGRSDEVRQILRSLDERWGDTWRGDDVSSLRIRSLDAKLLAEEGHLTEAIALSEGTLEQRRRLLGNSSRSVLVDMNNLAALYRAAGRLDDAEQLHRSTYAQRLAELGPDDEDTLVSSGNLAEILQLKTAGRDEARQLFLHAFQAAGKKLGPTHMSTLIAEYRLAQCDRLSEKYEAAGHRLRHIIGVLGETHRTYEKTYILAAHNLSMIESAQHGRRAGAEVLLDALVAISSGEAPLRDIFQDLVVSFDEAAMQAADKSLAEKGYQVILRASEQWQRTDTFSYCLAQGRIGSLLYDRLELDGAAAMYRGCLDGLLRLAHRGSLSEGIMGILGELVDREGAHLVETLRRKGDILDACQDGGRIARERVKLAGIPNERPTRLEEQLLRACTDAANQAQSGMEDAEVMLQVAYEGLSEVLGPAHPSSLSMLDSLGAYHGRLGQHAKALAVFVRGYDIASKSLGEDAETTQIFKRNGAQAAALVERAGGYAAARLPQSSTATEKENPARRGMGRWWQKSKKVDDG
jgi:hypothetical protein